MTLDNRLVVQDTLVFGRFFRRVYLHDEYGVQGRVARIRDVYYERIVQVSLHSFVQILAQVFAVDKPFYAI